MQKTDCAWRASLVQAFAWGAGCYPACCDPGGPCCTWVAAAKALRETGVKHFATVDDLAKAAGTISPGPAFVDQLVPFLQRLGARVTHLAPPGTWDDVVRAVRGNPDGSVLFSVIWTRSSGPLVSRHTLMAMRDFLGRIRFADRTGKVMKDLAELEKLFPGYDGISKAIPTGTMAVVHNSMIAEMAPIVATAGLLGRLALEIVAVRLRSK
jgi:hypothetical protein